MHIQTYTCNCKCIYRGFKKWWYPTTMGFPTKNDHFGVFWGYHHLRKHPYSIYTLRTENGTSFIVLMGRDPGRFTCSFRRGNSHFWDSAGARSGFPVVLLALFEAFFTKRFLTLKWFPNKSREAAFKRLSDNQCIKLKALRICGEWQSISKVQDFNEEFPGRVGYWISGNCPTTKQQRWFGFDLPRQKSFKTGCWFSHKIYAATRAQSQNPTSLSGYDYLYLQKQLMDDCQTPTSSTNRTA